MKPVGAPTPTTFVLGITYCLLYSKSSLSWGLVPISLSSSSSSLQWRSGDQMTSHRRRHDSVVGATLSPCNPQVGNSGVFSLSMTGQQPQQYELSRLLNCKVSKQRQEQSQPHASQRELTSRDDVSSVDTEHDTRRRHLLLRAISISSSLLLVSVADTSMAAAAVVAPPSASTVSPSSNILTGVGGDIGGGLQPATDEQPQIPFPDTATLQKQQQQASLEGLLYLKNPRSDRRPMGNDVIILTVQRVGDELTTSNEEILAGAKIPVSRIGSFPVRFKLTERNVVMPTTLSSASSTSKIWSDAMASGDLVVRAIVCKLPDDDSSLTTLDFKALLKTCQTTAFNGLPPPMQATGLAKLVRLQKSIDEGVPVAADNGIASAAITTTVVIRAPVSLPLE